MTRPFKKVKTRVPDAPRTGDSTVDKWMIEVTRIAEKLTGNGKDRAITAQELIDSGIGEDGGGGTIKPPTDTTKPVLTVPPLVTGITAQGGFALIILHWDNTAALYANHGFYEILRADVNDVGQAVLIGTSQTRFYNDAIGTGARKWYWVRAVSDQGVRGSVGEGVYAETSYDVSYVMDLLTATVWQPNTVYQPFQYVRPTVDNERVYVCIDGGVSGLTEPTWPTTVGHVVNDNDVTWQCRPEGEKVPFGIGLVDGVMSVVINKAFIADASIESAKIKNLVADKILAGKLQVGQDIEVGSAIWSGFSDFFNVGAVAGWWMGFIGGNPAFKIATENEERYIKFDGVDLEMNVDIVSSADAYFDDVRADTIAVDRVIVTPTIQYDARVEFSDYAINLLDNDDFNFTYYLSLYGDIYRSVSQTATGLIGNGGDSLYTIDGAGASRGGGVKTITPLHNGLKPFNEPDEELTDPKYERFIKPNIALRLQLKFQLTTGVGGAGSDGQSMISTMIYDFYGRMIAYTRDYAPSLPFGESSTTLYFVDPEDDLDIVHMHAFAPHDMTPPQHIDSMPIIVNKRSVTVGLTSFYVITFILEDDEEKLKYFKVAPTDVIRMYGGGMVKNGFALSAGDDANRTGTIEVTFQLWKRPRQEIITNEEPIL